MREFKAFFVGGPLDGTWRTVKRGDTRIKLTPEQQQLPLDGPKPDTVQYESFDIPIRDSRGTVRVYCRLFYCNGSPTAALSAVIEAYEARASAQTPDR